jgi:hypothetical protein
VKAALVLVVAAGCLQYRATGREWSPYTRCEPYSAYSADGYIETNLRGTDWMIEVRGNPRTPATIICQGQEYDMEPDVKSVPFGFVVVAGLHCHNMPTGCVDDSECKGFRICEQGRCRDP